MQKLNLIPEPEFLELQEGHFSLKPDAAIIAGTQEAMGAAQQLAACFSRGTGFALAVASGDESEPQAGLYLTTRADNLEGEAYELEVTPSLIRLNAAHTSGLLRGIQTVRQIFPAEIESASAPIESTEWTAPCLRISDRPRFSWRGLLFDCSRHFIDVDYTKRILDLLAFHKMNVLHWHLTEDQGWRIEIKKYPKLTEVGAWRDRNSPYGGYYTQEQVREIVAYAADRGIMVVPEIELPGHATAAIAAHPELSCTGKPLEVSSTWGVKKDVFCAGKDSTFSFLQDVLGEVIELFPAPYIHIGADECPKDRWRECPRCQERIRAEKLEDENELQSYFVQRISSFLAGHGRQAIGWDEIMEGGPPAEAVIVQGWRSQEDPVRTAARRGYRVIASQNDKNYYNFDVAWLDLSQAYLHEIIPADMSEAEQERILGGECCLWTEYIRQSRVENVLFPRLLAAAENLWTAPANKDASAFYERVKAHCRRLDQLGVFYGAAYVCGREPAAGM